MTCKWKTLFAGGGIWMLLLLFFWNTLYGNTLDRVTTTEDLFQYTSSSVGLQAPFLHATAFLMIYILLLSHFLSGSQIYQLYRMKREKYSRKLRKDHWRFALFFVLVYGVTYMICVWKESSILLLQESGFLISILFYSVILLSFYDLFGLIFLLLSSLVSGKWKGMILTVGIAIGCLCLFYFTQVPTPFQGMDVFDMVYYQRSILLFTYGRRLLFNLLLIFVMEYLFYSVIRRKDVIENEVL